ncbi:hypothetical protein Golax_012430 [Gossypium laxum]|uniref:AMP-dependent synthetase/ligase domain-containing protein n=1 Tax=Gossypium laxum TaxID=34288 RepID=A0A7J8ZPY1_9ROSI|nr:hypothetical protein [Gossypium laxum]
MAKFGLDKVLGAIEKYKVTHMFVVPPVMVSLAKQWQMMNNKYDLSSLKQIISSAASLSRDLIEICAHILPHVQIFQAYGMTEACGNISMENPKGGPPFSGSTGTLMPLIQSKIVSVTTMNPLPPNQMGEICIRGPTITLGNKLYNEPWFNPVGSYYYFMRQVAAAELEGLLLSHPDVVDAVVIP